MIELIDVWKGPKRATSGKDCLLAGATVSLPAGRRIGLIGPEREKNAAVMDIFAGIEQPDKGAVRRVGVPCWPFSYYGFTDPGATVRQNASFIGRVYGVDADEIARITGELSGVRVARGRQLKHYSVADRRALQMGMTLALQFDWYFVDERLPKAPDDMQETIHAAITDRISRASLVWASSNAEFLGTFCDAGLILDQGLLTFYDDFAEAAAAYSALTATPAKAIDEDDGQTGGNRRRRRAARRARKNSLDEPV